MIKDSTVRIATWDDFPELMRLSRLICAETGIYEIDEFKVAKIFERAFTGKGGIIGVIGKPGNLEAFIYLLLDPVWYADAWQLVEFCNFVHPDYRRSRHARALIAFSKTCADSIGVRATIGIFNGIRTKAKVRFYDSMLPNNGAIYLYTPPSLMTNSAKEA